MTVSTSAAGVWVAFTPDTMPYMVVATYATADAANAAMCADRVSLAFGPFAAEV